MTSREDLEQGLILYKRKEVKAVRAVWKVRDGDQIYLVNFLSEQPCGCMRFLEARSCPHVIASQIARKYPRRGCEEGVA